ncbi:hypothetical protein LTR66_003840 [Elasticomyces elasticus]|nr:hypothetical protein LTR66_003840 [Elasticomyces elasticus]
MHANEHPARDEVYFFVIEGLPRIFTWKELKDLCRDAIEAGTRQKAHIGWTTVAPSLKGPSLTGERGWVRLKRLDETKLLYSVYETLMLVATRSPANVQITSALLRSAVAVSEYIFGM